MILVPHVEAETGGIARDMRRWMNGSRRREKKLPQNGLDSKGRMLANLYLNPDAQLSIRTRLVLAIAYPSTGYRSFELSSTAQSRWTLHLTPEQGKFDSSFGVRVIDHQRGEDARHKERIAVQGEERVTTVDVHENRIFESEINFR